MAQNGTERSPGAPSPTQASKKSPLGIIPSGGMAIGLIMLIALFLLLFDPHRRINYSEFERLVAAGQIKSLKLTGTEHASGEVRDKEHALAKEFQLASGQFSVILPYTNDQYEFIERVKAADQTHRDELKKSQPADGTPPIKISKEDDQLAFLGPFLWTFLPLLLFGLFFVFYLLPRLRDPSSGGFLNSYVRSPARRYERGKSRITFEDVAGMESAKRELAEIVDFLRNADKFSRLGAQVPKGVLLVGPPGTGKTLLAKAVAGEANVPFFSINGSEFIQMFVGVGASRVRDLFKSAKENAPCVIFIDEIDAVGRMRGAGVGGGSDEREQTLNQILSEMDGFQPTETVIVLAATNRPDVLDAALLRPGRFDRHVTVDRPTWQGRLAILKVHTRNKPLADSVDLERIARNMIGMSGADLRNLSNEAALIATREGKNKIEQSDFDAAGDRVRLGAKREEVVSEKEKLRTAVHEAGHALCAWLEPKADPIDRVSIVPRGRSGGVTLFQPDEDRMDMAQSELTARLVVAMGGRAADRLVFGEPLSGAIQDLKQATRIARMMVTQFGMSDRLGPVAYRIGDEHVFLGKEIHESRDFSEGTAQIIDEEVQKLLSQAETRATDLLRKNRDDLDVLTQALLKEEELDRAGVEALLRKAPREESDSNAADSSQSAIDTDPPHPKLAIDGAGG